MFLTQFPINVTRRETRYMLSSPYRLHAAIEGSFPAARPVNGNGRVLWRVDRSADGSASLFIVSPTKPSLVGLDEQIGWPDIEPQWQTRDYTKVLNRIAAGQIYRFRLVANPVVSRKRIPDEQGRSKRLPHVTALQQASWLVGAKAYDEVGAEPPEHLAVPRESRAEQNGFSIVRDEVSGMGRMVVSDLHQWSFKQGSSGNNVRLTTVRYDGVLEVRDAERLRHALICGIGRAKGFGCGLLTLAPVTRP